MNPSVSAVFDNFRSKAAWETRVAAWVGSVI